MSELNRFEHIPKAVYTEQVLADYKGNPMIEALPPILSAEEAYEGLKHYPSFDLAELEEGPHIRYQAIPRLGYLIEPGMQHLDLERRVSTIIRHGYVTRNPITPEFIQTLNGTRPVTSSASSLTLMGFSGIGKTTAIEKVLSLYPQLYLHQDPVQMVQVVHLKLNCPYDGSLKALCIDFFTKMGELMGEDLVKKYTVGNKSISNMVSNVAKVARLQGLGVLVIDEIQHLLSAQSGNADILMNFLVSLMNESGIPIVMVGTMRARAFLQKDFRQARRGSGQGAMIWEQRKEDMDWNYLLEELWRYQWTKHRAELTQEMKDVIYYESQGITDIAVKLFGLAQGDAIVSGEEHITPSSIRESSNRHLKLLQPMLAALREGRLSELEQYGDIMPMKIEHYLVTQQSKLDLQATLQKKKEEQAQKRKDDQYSDTAKLVGALLGLGIDSKKAQKAAVDSLNTYPNHPIPFLVARSIDWIEKMEEQEEQKKEKPKRQESTKNKLVLLKLFNQAYTEKRTTHEVFKEAGYVVDPLKELTI